MKNLSGNISMGEQVEVEKPVKKEVNHAEFKVSYNALVKEINLVEERLLKLKDTIAYKDLYDAESMLYSTKKSILNIEPLLN